MGRNARAKRIRAEALRRRTGAEHSAGPKGTPEKLSVAARLRMATTMTVGWVAERLQMGCRGNLNHLLYRAEARSVVVAKIKN